MELNEYQDKAMSTCLESSNNHLYMLHGLSEEVGELHGKFAKALRKGYITCDGNSYAPTDKPDEDYDELELSMMKEAGDVAWMLAGLCKVMGWTLEEVCQMNLDKLADRKKRGVIDSKGDNR